MTFLEIILNTSIVFPHYIV